jgi:hypothetical protein
MSTSHSTTATATRNLCPCCRPCPCPRRLSTSRVDVASSRHHRHVQSLLSLSSPTLSLSLPPVNLLPSPLCAIVVVVLVISAAIAARNNRCRPRCLLMLMPKSHPPAVATASRNNWRCYCCPCLPPCRQTMSMSHPTTATATRDCLCPCLPPRRRSMLHVGRQS